MTTLRAGLGERIARNGDPPISGTATVFGTTKVGHPETQGVIETRHARRVVRVQSQPPKKNQHGCTQREGVAPQSTEDEHQLQLVVK